MDGKPYGEADHGGYQVTINGGAPVTLPVTWGLTFDLGTLQTVQALKAGTHTATIAPVSKKGVVGPAVSTTFSVFPTPAALGNFSIT